MTARSTLLPAAALLTLCLVAAWPAEAQGPWRHADPQLGLAFELDPTRLPVGGQVGAVVLDPDALRALGVADVRRHDQARLTSLGQGRFRLDVGGRQLILSPGLTPGFAGVAAEPLNGFKPAPGRPLPGPERQGTAKLP